MIVLNELINLTQHAHILIHLKERELQQRGLVGGELLHRGQQAGVVGQQSMELIWPALAVGSGLAGEMRLHVMQEVVARFERCLEVWVAEATAIILAGMACLALHPALLSRDQPAAGVVEHTRQLFHEVRRAMLSQVDCPAW